MLPRGARPGAEIGAIGSERELEEVLDELGVFHKKLGGIAGMSSIVISKSAEHFKLYEEGSKLREENPLEAHKILGSFFGYPQCCVDRYVEDLSKGISPVSRYFTQLVEKVHGMTESRLVTIIGKLGVLPGVSNLLAKFAPRFMESFAAVLLCYHIPCSPDCKESVKTGKTMLNNLGKVDPELRDFFFQMKVSSLTMLLAAHSDYVLKGKYFTL